MLKPYTTTYPDVDQPLDFLIKQFFDTCHSDVHDVRMANKPAKDCVMSREGRKAKQVL